MTDSLMNLENSWKNEVCTPLPRLRRDYSEVTPCRDMQQQLGNMLLS